MSELSLEPLKCLLVIEDDIIAGCPFCGGEEVVERTPAGAGHADDLAEYEPCARCQTVRRLADIMRRSR